MERPINDFDDEIYIQMMLPALTDEELLIAASNKSIDNQNLWEDEQIFI